ncbi:hypothetical protein SVAN01_04871 [Stagonosporopsis vannaccii]|nr:hypothetical protein SVAN01_04871 [Stagonosporopsis vannaccii]
MTRAARKGDSCRFGGEVRQEERREFAARGGRAGLYRHESAETLGPIAGFTQSIIVPLGVVKVCASARDRRRGLPSHSGRLAASPSPNPVLNADAGGRALFEWCTAREAPRRHGLMQPRHLLVVWFDDAPDRPRGACLCSFVIRRVVLLGGHAAFETQPARNHNGNNTASTPVAAAGATASSEPVAAPCVLALGHLRSNGIMARKNFAFPAALPYARFIAKSAAGLA